MIKNARLIIVFAAFAVVFGLAETSFSQTAPRVGGYRKVSVEDATVAAAAEFAAKMQAEKQEIAIEVSEIHKAERQTVAGANYRLCLSANVVAGEDAESEIKQFVAVVYQNLKGVFQLKSWKEEQCHKDDE